MEAPVRICRFKIRKAIEADFLELSSPESPINYYPNGIFASSINPGYTDAVEETIDNKTVTTLVGKAGLEGLYNEQVTGTAGESIFYQR